MTVKDEISAISFIEVALVASSDTAVINDSAHALVVEPITRASGEGLLVVEAFIPAAKEDGAAVAIMSAMAVKKTVRFMAMTF